MSRILVVGSEAQVSREIGEALSAADFPMEYSAGHADTLQRLRVRSFGVVITNPNSTVEEDLALLDEPDAGLGIVRDFLAPLHAGNSRLDDPRGQRIFSRAEPFG